MRIVSTCSAHLLCGNSSAIYHLNTEKKLTNVAAVEGLVSVVRMHRLVLRSVEHRPANGHHGCNGGNLLCVGSRQASGRVPDCTRCRQKGTAALPRSVLLLQPAPRVPGRGGLVGASSSVRLHSMAVLAGSKRRSEHGHREWTMLNEHSNTGWTQHCHTVAVHGHPGQRPGCYTSTEQAHPSTKHPNQLGGAPDTPYFWLWMIILASMGSTGNSAILRPANRWELSGDAGRTAGIVRQSGVHRDLGHLAAYSNKQRRWRLVKARLPVEWKQLASIGIDRELGHLAACDATSSWKQRQPQRPAAATVDSPTHSGPFPKHKPMGRSTASLQVDNHTHSPRVVSSPLSFSAPSAYSCSSARNIVSVRQSSRGSEILVGASQATGVRWRGSSAGAAGSQFEDNRLNQPLTCGRRVHEVEVDEVVDAQGLEQQHHVAQVGALRARSGGVASAVLSLCKPTAQPATVAAAAAAAAGHGKLYQGLTWMSGTVLSSSSC